MLHWGGVASLRHISGSSSYTYYAALTLQPRIAAFEGDGTVFGAIGKKQLEALTIIAPDPKTVAAFHRTIDPLDQQIECGLREIASLSLLRDTLLPRLISGGLRVGDAKARIAAA